MKKMKMWVGMFSGIMAVFITVSLVAVGLPVCAEETGTEPLPEYVASDGFSETQGKNGWSYSSYLQREKENGYKENYTRYDTGSKSWRQGTMNDRGRIWSDRMLPGTAVNTATLVQRFAAVRTYTVNQKKATITISTNPKTNNGKISAVQSAAESEAFFNVQIRVRKNNVTIYPVNEKPEEEKWESLESRDASIDFQPIEVDVKEGDVIRFEAIRGADCDEKAKMNDNIIYWDPVIRYTSVVQRQEIYRDNFTTLNSDFWRNKTNDWTVEDGWLKNSGTSSYIRFYTPHAVNYTMSFDLKFLNIGTASSDQSGFFITTRRSNDASGLYYRVRFDLSSTAVQNDVVYGLGVADGFKSTSTCKPQRVKKGASPWETDKIYHVTESVETDENSKTVLTFTVTDTGGTTVSSFTASFSGEDVCPAGGGGLSLIGNHQVAISNFVLEGEASELVVDNDVKFFADEGLQNPVTADTLNGELYAAIKTASGFSNDFSSKETPRTIILAAYQNEGDGSLRLKTVKMNRVYVTSATDAVSVSLAADETEPGLTYRAFVWEEVGNMNPCAPVQRLE